MAFTEFYCNSSTGSNLNAGDNTANGVVTSTNGNWGIVAANRFTAVSGTPFSGVSIGDFASIYLDGATVAVYIARVTAVNDGGASLDLSSTAIAGTAPVIGATGRSCTTGGVWKGPNGTSSFPFNTVSGLLTNAAGDVVRVNFKNNAQYNITATMSHAPTSASGVIFEGYSSTPGDNGQAVIDGGTSGASYILFTPGNVSCVTIQNIIFQNNGATGTASGITGSSGSILWRRCCVNNVRGDGFNATSTGHVYLECESHACNKSGTALKGGFSGCGRLIRCISHDNTATGSVGFGLGLSNGACLWTDCIADSNANHGFYLRDQASMLVMGCDSYNNGGDGINLANTSTGGTYLIENCNLVKNTGWGINGSGSANRHGYVRSCGYGSGTQSNGSGQSTGLKSIIESGAVTYPSNVTPWIDPANGDFRINLEQAKGAGAAPFFQSASGYAGTVGYPDIGAAPHTYSVSNFLAGRHRRVR